MAPISNINVGAFVANIAAHQDAGHTAGLDPKFNQPKWELFKDKDFTDILVNAGGQALLNEVYNAAPKTKDLMCILSFAETFNLDAAEIRALANEVRPLPAGSKNPAHVINSAVIQAKKAGMNDVQTQAQAVRKDVEQFVLGMLGGAGVQTHPSMKTNPHKHAFTTEIKNAFNNGTPISQHNPILNLPLKKGVTVKAAFERLTQLQAQLRNMPRVNDLNAQAEANYAKLAEVVGDPRFRPHAVGGHAGPALLGVAKGPGPKVAPKMPPRPAKGAGKAPGAAPKGAPMPKAPGPVVGAAPPPPPPMPKAPGALAKGPGAGIAPPPPPPEDDLEPPAGPLAGLDFDENFNFVVMEEHSDVSDSEMSDLELADSEISDSDVSDSDVSDLDLTDSEEVPPPPEDVVHPPEVDVPPAPGKAPPPPPPMPQAGGAKKAVPKAPPAAPKAPPAQPKGGQGPNPADLAGALANLHHAPPADRPEPEVPPLLAEIHQGVKLKHVDPKAPGAVPKAPGGMAGALNQALNAINQQVANTDDESDDSNNESWED